MSKLIDLIINRYRFRRRKMQKKETVRKSLQTRERDRNTVVNVPKMMQTSIDDGEEVDIVYIVRINDIYELNIYYWFVVAQRVGGRV